MNSVSAGKLQQNNPCDHYKYHSDVITPWIPRMDVWYSSTNHAIPNPGYWIAGTNDISGVWGTVGQSPYYGSANPSSIYGSWNNPTEGLPVLAVPYAPYVGWQLLPTITLSQWDDYIASALSAMLPGLKAELSLPNSLFELKDMKTLSRSMQRIQTGLDALKGLFSFRQGVKSTLLSLRSVLRASSDSYLQGNFNIAPLLSDIANLKKAVLGLRKELRELQDRANRPQRRHFKKPLEWYVTSQDSTVFPLSTQSYVYPAITASRWVNYPIRMFNATIDYSYSLPSMSEAEFRLFALLDKVGFLWNPAIIWNAIPWSFVVDWVLGVGRYLEQFQTRNIEPIVHITGFTYSGHVRREVTTSLVCGQHSGPVFRSSEDAYTRKVGLPERLLINSLRTSGLNPKEFSLAAALRFSR
jgi:hypothetical protein